MSQTQSFLKTSSVNIDDHELSIHQLNGLDRFEYNEYAATIERPDELVRPDNEAPIEEKEAYLRAMPANIARWNKVNFKTQSRLVAYGIKTLDEDIEQKHQWVMTSFTPEAIKCLYDAITTLSGMVQVISEVASDEESDESENKEPLDPKS